jgi:hypothetical protein
MKTKQTEKIKNHLERGFSITPLEALNLFGCLRLGARIHDLKRAPYNMNINSELVTLNSGKRVAQYSLK